MCSVGSSGDSQGALPQPLTVSLHHTEQLRVLTVVFFLSKYKESPSPVLTAKTCQIAMSSNDHLYGAPRKPFSGQWSVLDCCSASPHGLQTQDELQLQKTALPTRGEIQERMTSLTNFYYPCSLTHGIFPSCSPPLAKQKGETDFN